MDTQQYTLGDIFRIIKQYEDCPIERLTIAIAWLSNNYSGQGATYYEYLSRLKYLSRLMRARRPAYATRWSRYKFHPAYAELSDWQLPVWHVNRTVEEGTFVEVLCSSEEEARYWQEYYHSLGGARIERDEDYLYAMPGPEYAPEADGLLWEEVV